MPVIDEMLIVIEENLKTQVQRSTNQPGMDGLQSMLAYHMGWEGEGAGLEARGKRLRPLLVSLCCAACGEDWRISLPAASAVELLHNFSLLHDDIEDNSPLRRGRPTVWKQWGIPHAINAGDAMFTLAHLAILDFKNTLPAFKVLQCCHLFQTACLTLTQGQYLDISFEQLKDVNLDDYWQMISGKTAALLACCCELGALAGGANSEMQMYYRQFGLSLGLAFQAMDDILGIWGEIQMTGKSTKSDLATGKKSLPVLYGLSLRGTFYQRWRNGKVPSDEVAIATEVLTDEGANDYAQKFADRLTEDAMCALANAHPSSQVGLELKGLTESLLRRKH